MADNSYDDVRELNVGDRFQEDCYPETYVVREKTQFGIVAEDEASGQTQTFGYTDSAYAPVIIKLPPKPAVA